eukprot:CAMPEP_0174730498 /NCGR_PEP_ID=MMETSP1094-20130205/55752_1 /TAXON_ID=156173 /ORGANISM="Chrysochromulina brevifilum, Strain UTEX LB 985" /LENGTH=219 /DNA_ID=CAMNT_0015932775 /DNA_START=602 /DNA_END=1261 /DNA_ORIENTATION=+
MAAQAFQRFTCVGSLFTVTMLGQMIEDRKSSCIDDIEEVFRTQPYAKIEEATLNIVGSHLSELGDLIEIKDNLIHKMITCQKTRIVKATYENGLVSIGKITSRTEHHDYLSLELECLVKKVLPSGRKQTLIATVEADKVEVQSGLNIPEKKQTLHDVMQLVNVRAMGLSARRQSASAQWIETEREFGMRVLKATATGLQLPAEKEKPLETFDVAWAQIP